MSGYWVPNLEGHPIAVWEMYASHFFESAKDDDVIRFQDRLNEMRNQSVLVLERGRAQQNHKAFRPLSPHRRCA